MDSSFIFVEKFLETPRFISFLNKTQKIGRQWYGPHFSVALLYAMSLSRSNSERDGFSDLLTRLGNSTRHPGKFFWLSRSKSDGSCQRFLGMMVSFMPELRKLLTIPELQNCLSISNLKRTENFPELQNYLIISSLKKTEILACFINFQLHVIKRISSMDVSVVADIIIPDQIRALLEHIKLLPPILGDTPFQESETIVPEIESMANEVASFLNSFFFTTEHVSEGDMNESLSDLLTKFVTLEAKIKEHCVTFSKLPKFTTKNSTFSIFLVDSVLDDLYHLINHKADLIVEVKDQITKLHEELKISRSFFRYIEMHQNKEVTARVTRLMELAYEVEYVITWFLAETIPVWYLALRLPTLIEKNKVIGAAAQEFNLNSGTKSIEVAESSSEVSLQFAKSIRRVDEITVGLEEKTRQIVAQLVGGQRRLQIISIIGMPGLGKTALANKLYNHSLVLSHFDKRSWCVVSQTYEKRKLLLDILSSLTEIDKDKISKMEDSELAETLYKNLKGRRYLIVIDDIWDADVWDDLKRYFPDDTNGSRIIFTSRNKDVASSDEFIHELDLLSIDECWDLLQKKVFQNGICPEERRELEDIGKKNCNIL